MKSRNILSVSPGAILLLAVILFFADLEALCSLMLAVIVHEAGHYSALSLFSGRVDEIRFNITGAVINTRAGLTKTEEIICLVAGPLAGVLFAYASSTAGRAMGSDMLLQSAGISLVLSGFNLLPILPMDGGRILDTSWDNPGGVKVVSFILTLALLCLGLALIALHAGAGLFVAGIWLMIEQAYL